MPTDRLALLFHPKKNAKKPAQSLAASKPTNVPPNRKPPPPAPIRRPKPEDEDEDFKLPDSQYNEFKLLSSALNGWKYDVMKFDSRKPVDISSWKVPIKLNRKDLRRDDPNTSGPPQAVKPMLGPDGNQVFGPDGKAIMVDIEGRIVSDSVDGTASKGKGAANGKKKFQKKTRQVFKVPEETRQLRREERYPWVLEDSTGSETWIAQLEDLERSSNCAFFMPAANDAFKFVPAHRWYKFQKKLNHDLPRDTLSVESAYSMSQKRDPQTWLSQRNGKGPSEATAAMFKAESEGRSLTGSSSLVYDFQSSSSAGGRKLKAVDSGMNLFGDDEEDEAFKRRKEREYGGEGDLDENEYEEDFADDDDKMNVDDNDEEAKELEERLKKEYKSANKTREGYIDESDEEELPDKTKQEKAMQKLILKREGNDAYETDEDKNPYASTDDEEDEEEIIPPPPPPPAPAEPLPIKSEETKPVINTAVPSPTASHPTSPVSSTLGGHSVVAKRATSPKAPKLKPNNVSRGSSPLAGRSTSPPASNSRATSPVAGAGGSRATSPVNNSAPNGSQKKRKAEELSPNGAAAPKPKKRKAPPGAGPQGELEPRLLIDWLRNTPNASTRDCIAYFSAYITEDQTKKDKFTKLVRKCAQLKDGILILRKEFRDSSAPPASPEA